MVSDIGINLDGITALQQRGAALTARLQATLDGIPETTTGWDARRVVRVDLNRMAGVEAIVVADSWKDALDAEHLAGAVLEARASADSAYTEALEAASAAATQNGAGTDATAPAPADHDLLDRAKSFGPTRSAVDLAESTLAAAEPSTTAGAAPATDEWVIETPKSVELTIESGILVACRIDARWADSHSAAVINGALAAEIAENNQPDEEGGPAGRDDDLVELLAAILNTDFSTSESRN